MDKFTKLPSGKWNKRVYDYTDEKGRKHTKSFTASTKAEIKQMIAEWKVDRLKEHSASMTVLEACRRTLELKRSSLSPTTIREYGNAIKNAVEPYKIAKVDINKLKSADVQLWISEISEKRAPKTVKNYYAFVLSSVDMFNPDARIRVKLPERKKYEPYCPSSKEIKTLLDYLLEHNERNIRNAVLLSSIATLRRSEICALTSSDLDEANDTITVCKAMVKDEDRKWVLKSPKTVGSNRIINVSHRLFSALEYDGDRIVTCNPDTISDRFSDILKDAGLPHFRFHDLRHYSASIMAYLLISSTTSKNRGGWTSDVMETVYHNRISSEQKKEEKKINKYFDKHLLA